MSISELYSEYINKKYERPIVAFDGYVDWPSTKDATHQWRTDWLTGTVMKFDEKMSLTLTKEQFTSI